MKGTPQTDVVEEVERTAHYPIMRIVTTMRISAMMLEIADSDNPKRNKCNLMQAKLLRAAARDLAAQFKEIGDGARSSNQETWQNPRQITRLPSGPESPGSRR